MNVGIKAHRCTRGPMTRCLEALWKRLWPVDDPCTGSGLSVVDAGFHTNDLGVEEMGSVDTLYLSRRQGWCKMDKVVEFKRTGATFELH